MNSIVTSDAKQIKKLQVKEAVSFAIENIPEADRATLEKFLAIVNTTGTFGSISHEQIRGKMQFTLKYIPDACPRSLLIVAELLELPMAAHPHGIPPGYPAHLPVSQAEQLILSSKSETVSAS
ncbi:MAG: hypothetical protein OES12_06725 [Anaerolineae bacterium]|jgi:hypothetical protein|nr:hypothetical protein [Anaerolineae bacterium]